MSKISKFIHQLSFDDLPEQVIHQSSICLLDLLGVAIAGHRTKSTAILLEFVGSQYPGSVPLLFSDKTASVSGAALFGGMLIDSIDAHDGQVLTKGHAGVALLPSLLAIMHDKEGLDGKALLTNLVLGYEIATRAGIALHATACDYHTSGAWNAIGATAMCARVLGLSEAQTLEALGTAEFYGPRSQMMRCIDYPTMVKDGSGWGALAGTSAALLAQLGFVGAPAISLLGDDVAQFWDDLGEHWYILDQYFKAYPVCRWAQPAVEAVRQLTLLHEIDSKKIESIDIFSFHEAKRLHTVHPETTEEAQYSLPFSVASVLVDGTVTIESIAETKQGLNNSVRQALSAKVKIHECDRYNDLFPAERWAHAEIKMQSGECYKSSGMTALGDPENPLTLDQIQEKFHLLSQGAMKLKEREFIIESCINIKEAGVEQLKEFKKLIYRAV